ncbi:MAG: ankyrin repeat domain-containing protein [Wolbachia sp.]
MLHIATRNDLIEVAELLIKGANVNEVNEEEHTPLHYTTVQNHTEIVNDLIKEGVDVDK